MFIVSGNNEAIIREKQIDAPIQKLYFRGIIDGQASAGFLNPMADVIKQLNYVKISISKQTPNGTEQILLPIGLGSIAEICSNTEGHINVKNIKSLKTGKYVLSFECTVELSAGCAIDSKDGKFLLLTIDMKDSNVSNLDVYGLDYPVVGNEYIAYKQLKCQANATKSVNLIGKNVLALPRRNFVSIDLVYSDGSTRTCTYKDDIKAITQCVENLCANYIQGVETATNEVEGPLHD